MPIYEYRCTQCDFQKEHLQKISDAPLTRCPACGHDSYTKLVSAAGFRLTGSGWYATDFKGGATAASNTASSSEQSATAASGGCGGGCACHPN